MRNENQLQALLHDIETYLGPFPDIFPNGEVSEVCKNMLTMQLNYTEKNNIQKLNYFRHPRILCLGTINFTN